jgi:hypothetical protein
MSHSWRATVTVGAITHSARHYHADRGGVVVRVADRLWALSRNRRHRIALRDESWLRELGHGPDEYATIPAADVEEMIDHGLAGP